MSDLKQAILFFMANPGLEREFAYTLSAMKKADKRIEELEADLKDKDHLFSYWKSRATTSEATNERLRAALQDAHKYLLSASGAFASYGDHIGQAGALHLAEEMEAAIKGVDDE